MIVDRRGRTLLTPIPKFDDRFARQNRCEPPPEFPLASPYSGIVHHLSGPNTHALPQIHRKSSGPGVGALHDRGLDFHFHYALGFRHPNTRVDVRLLGPCFKTGRLRPLCQRPSRSAFLGPGRSHCTLGYKTPPRGGYLPRPFARPPNPTLARPRGSTPARMPAEPRERVWSQALPFQQFHVLFNSLFKVLFIFRSLYLCAIGLRPIFSFR